MTSGGHNKLKDEVAACNIIRCKRKYAHNYKHKTITIHFYIDNIKLSSPTFSNYNPLTKNYSICGSGIRYKNIEIHPTTHQKLKCINQHALDYLNSERKSVKNRMRRKRTKREL